MRAQHCLLRAGEGLESHSTARRRRQPGKQAVSGLCGSARIRAGPPHMSRMRAQPEARRGGHTLCPQKGRGLTAPSQERGKKGQKGQCRAETPGQLCHQFSHQHLPDAHTTIVRSNKNQPISQGQKIPHITHLIKLLHNAKMCTSFPCTKSPIVRKTWILKNN